MHTTREDLFDCIYDFYERYGITRGFLDTNKFRKHLRKYDIPDDCYNFFQSIVDKGIKGGQLKWRE